MLAFLAYTIGVLVLLTGYVHLRSWSQPLHWSNFTSSPWVPKRWSSVNPSLKPRKSSPPTRQAKEGMTQVLPPSRRFALPDTIRSTSSHESEDTVLQNQIDLAADFKPFEPTRFTPTGFSVREIQQLGDFPDYATLSGVPLPSSYPEFDIDKALPRPYRPFRWNYHQTMCMSSFDSSVFFLLFHSRHSHTSIH